jgi:NhaP-type Na+/H+ or K+/H+ antiporter
MIAYTPKATVQAAIGAIPLSMGLACGDKVLTVAVLSIIFTAPLGAFMIDKNYRRLLEQSNNEEEIA